MARGWHRVGEIPTLGVLGHFPDRRLAQRRRTRLLEFVPDQLDDPQQLVADVRVLPAQELSELIQVAVPPDPSVDGHRHPCASDDRRGQQRGAEPDRRVPRAIHQEHQQVCGHDREDRRTGCLHHLDGPDPAAEFVQLPSVGPQAVAAVRAYTRGSYITSQSTGSLKQANSSHERVSWNRIGAFVTGLFSMGAMDQDTDARLVFSTCVG